MSEWRQTRVPPEMAGGRQAWALYDVDVHRGVLVVQLPEEWVIATCHRNPFNAEQEWHTTHASHETRGSAMAEVEAAVSASRERRKKAVPFSGDGDSA